MPFLELPSNVAGVPEVRAETETLNRLEGSNLNMLISLHSVPFLLCLALVGMTCPLSADEVLTCSNGKLQIAVSRQTGALVSLRSLQPTLLELLEPPGEPLMLLVEPGTERSEGHRAEDWSAPLDRVRRLKVDGNRVEFTIATQKRPVVEADVVYDLTGDFMRLTARLHELTRDPGRWRIVWAQPSVPAQQLYSYPYSEGIASTGHKPFLRLGSSGSVMSRQTFPADAQVDVNLMVLTHGLEPWTSIRYRMQPNGDGYHIALAENGHKVSCSLLKSGQWVTSGSGLGSSDVEWSLGKPHGLRIVGRSDGFDVFLEEARLFEVQDTAFVSGAVGIKQGYSGECRVHSVTMRAGGQTILADDFSTYPIGGEPEVKWIVRAGFVEVSDGGNEWGGYPARFIDLADRHIVWGQFDLNRPVILNHIETKAPWVASGFGISDLGFPVANEHGEAKASWLSARPQRNESPKSQITNRKSQILFDLFVTVFSRPQFARRDAIRWYAQHMTHSGPFFARAPVRMTHTVSRTFPEGNFAFYWGSLSRLDSKRTREQVERMEGRMKALRFTNVIFTDWVNIPWSGAEQAPPDLAGGWFHPPSGNIKLGEKMREEVRRLKSEGFKVYLYFWPVTLFFNPRNESKLQGLIDCAKRAVEFYEPDGIGYDMNWQVHKQVLKLQHELYHWLQQKHPGKKVIIDYGFGTPSQLYGDSLISEFGLWMYGLPTNGVVESFTALRTNVTNLVYFAHPLRELKEKGQVNKIGIGTVNVRSLEEWYHTYCQLVMQSVALGGSWADDAFAFEQQEFEPVLKRTALAQFAAQTAAVPVVCETGVTQARPDDLIASVWANDRRLLVAAYRYRMSWKPEPGFFSPEQGGNPVTITLRRDFLAKQGLRKVSPLRLIVLDAEAMEKPASNFRAVVSRNAVTLTGDLGDGEMLLVTEKQRNEGMR